MMMSEARYYRKTLICILITSMGLVLLNAQVPNLSWAKGTGGTLNDFGYSVAVDAFGNVYTAGVYYGTVDFDPGPGVFNLTPPGPYPTAFFVCKLDSTGAFVWAKTFGNGTTTSIAMTVDLAGNVYTTGNFDGTIDFDPGPGVFNLTGTGRPDIFVSKLDAAGNFVWAGMMGGSTGADQATTNAIAVDAAGSVYTTGYFTGSSDFDPGVGVYTLSTAVSANDIYASKLDSSGNFVWAKSMGGNAGSAYSYSIAVDAFHNVYTTGSFSGKINFNPGPGTFNMTSVQAQDIFVSKLDSSGNFLWANGILADTVSPNANVGRAITVDASHVYITGDFSTAANFNAGGSTYILSPSGNTSSFVLKLDTSGAFNWARAFGGTISLGYGIAVDANSNIYTTGIFYNSGDFDPGSGVYTLTSKGGYDIYVSKLDPSGNFVWAFGTGGPDDDYGYAITVDGTGGLYTTGYFQDTVNFNTNTGTDDLISNGYRDIFIAKYKDNACAAPAPVVSITGRTSFCLGDSVILSAENYTAYVWSNGDTTRTTTIKATGTYSVTVTNACSTGISDTVPVMVTNNDTQSVFITSSATGPVCIGTTITLTAHSTNTGASPGYSWLLDGVSAGQDSSVFRSSTLKNNDAVALIILSDAACIVNPVDTSNTIILAVADSTHAGVINALYDTLCAGTTDSLWLTGNTTGLLQWQSSYNAITSFDGINDTSSSYSSLVVAGTSYYRVLASGTCGVDTSGIFKLVVNPLPSVSISSNDTLICAADSTMINPNGNYSSYLWNTDDTTSYIFAKQAGGYWLTVTDANGCSAVSNHQQILVYGSSPVSISVQGDTVSSFNAVSYQWLFNDSAITGATSSFYVAHQSGNYAVLTTDSNGCSAVSPKVNLTLTGLQDMYESALLNIYPNPFASSIIVQAVNGNSKIERVEVYDVLGRRVYSNENVRGPANGQLEIDLVSIVNGVYIVKVWLDGVSFEKRVIKE